MSDLEGDVSVIPEQGTVVDGVGNEIILAGALLLAVVTSVVLARRQSNGGIHPDLVERVEDTRREMGVGRGAVGGAEACPVCLVDMNYPVETNCGHQFCAECVLTYWQHDQWPRAARCPVCRREVTLLLASDELRRAATAEGQQLWAQVTDYNQRMSGEWRPLMHYIYDVPTLLRHMWRDLFTVGGLVLMHKVHLLLIAVLLLLYLLSPLDIFPESVMGVVGLIDDVIILIAALVYMTVLYRAQVAHHLN